MELLLRIIIHHKPSFTVCYKSTSGKRFKVLHLRLFSKWTLLDEACCKWQRELTVNTAANTDFLWNPQRHRSEGLGNKGERDDFPVLRSERRPGIDARVGEGDDSAVFPPSTCAKLTFSADPGCPPRRALLLYTPLKHQPLDNRWVCWSCSPWINKNTLRGDNRRFSIFRLDLNNLGNIYKYESARGLVRLS